MHVKLEREDLINTQIIHTLKPPHLQTVTLHEPDYLDSKINPISWVYNNNISILVHIKMTNI